MKKIILLLIIPFAVLVISSCNTTDDPVTSTTKGNIFVTSNPAGAEIWLGANNTSQTTPDTIKNLDEDTYEVTLKLTDYDDATFTVNVTYETLGTTANEPSGLDLSSGWAWGVSSDSSGLLDIYYSTDGTGGQGYLIQSADLFSGLIRETDFLLGNSENIFDEVDSPLRNIGTWTNNMSNMDSNYVFLYDHDGHYSKLKIVNSGGGVAGEPFWVQVQWYYNNTLLDKRF